MLALEIFTCTSFRHRELVQNRSQPSSRLVLVRSYAAEPYKVPSLYRKKVVTCFHSLLRGTGVCSAPGRLVQPLGPKVYCTYHNTPKSMTLMDTP